MFVFMHKIWHEIAPEPTIIISQSRDGDFITDVANRIGFEHTVRGAHGRGGVEAAKEIMEGLNTEACSLISLIDGPKGPRLHAKKGVVALAQSTGVPIIPIAGVGVSPLV